MPRTKEKVPSGAATPSGTCVKHGYSDALTIERIDVDGNYCPENCCWITRGDQARNRRSNRKLSLNGVSLTGAEWARRLGFKDKHAILDRIDNGWDIDKALTTPPRKYLGQLDRRTNT